MFALLYHTSQPSWFASDALAGLFIAGAVLIAGLLFLALRGFSLKQTIRILSISAPVYWCCADSWWSWWYEYSFFLTTLPQLLFG